MSPRRRPGAFFVSYRNAAKSVPGTMRIEGSNRRLSLHWTSLAEGNANFSIVIVFRYADDLMVGFQYREEAVRLEARSSLPTIHPAPANLTFVEPKISSSGLSNRRVRSLPKKMTLSAQPHF